MDLVNTHVANGALNGSYANVTVNGITLKVPVIIQPGQAKGSVGLAFGYGRTAKGIKDEMKTGVNAYKLYQNFNPIQDVTVELASGEHEFACVQLQNTLMGRGDIIKETTLEIFNTKDKEHWNEKEGVSYDHQEIPTSDKNVDIWVGYDHQYRTSF